MIWLILGPSGVGKSCFGAWLQAEKQWLYLEIDRFPEGDGIDLSNLRPEWDIFLDQQDGIPLSATVGQRAKTHYKKNVVLTFPSGVVLPPDHIKAAAKAGIGVFYLYGSKAHCIDSFLTRERKTQRLLNLKHWETNNESSYISISDPVFEPNRIHMFTHSGKHRENEEVFLEMLKRR